MKIVHVVYSLEMGGAEVLVAQLSRIQRSAGHAVSIVAYSCLGSVGETLRAEGFEIYVLGEAHPITTMRLCYGLFRRLRPDVVHCHNPAPTLQSAAPARLAGVGSIVSTRHSLVAPPYDTAAEVKYSVIARSCDWIVGICDITCENLRHAPLANMRKIVRVYNGVSPVERTRLAPELAQEGFTLLFVGRLAAIKNLETAIGAFAQASARAEELKLAPLNFWIVGDGVVRAQLEALANELQVGERVRFFGERMDTAGFFSAADAFLMSSVSEGLPMSLLQAMSLGLPAITTDVGGMAEVLRLSGSGLLAAVGDSHAMAENILRLAQDAELRSALSARAVAAYQQHFTLQQMYEGYLELYQRKRG